MSLNSPPYWFLLPPPPPGLNYVATIRYTVPFILINSVLAAILIPIFLALWFFSTPRSRRSLIFHFNVASVVLGVGAGALSLGLEIHDLFNPDHTLPQDVMTTRFILCLFTPIVVESILVLRLLGVFPPTTHGRRTRYLILAFPVIIKVVRTISASFVTASWISMTRSLNNSFRAGHTVWTRSPFVKLSWIAQLLDNTYASTIFVYKLNARKALCEVHTGGALQSRLKTIGIIAVSNYVFPTILSLVQLMLVFRRPLDPEWFMLCLIILNLNIFVTILGVVFATVWTSGGRWADVSGITEQKVRQTKHVVRSNNSATTTIQQPVSLRLETMREEGDESESCGDLGDLESTRSLTIVRSPADNRNSPRSPPCGRGWSLTLQLPPDIGLLDSTRIELSTFRGRMDDGSREQNISVGDVPPKVMTPSR